MEKHELDVRPINWLGLHKNYLVKDEMEVLVALMRNVSARLVAEFGCRDGRTAKVLLHNVPTIERYIGVDVPMSYQPGLPHQKSEMVLHPGYYVADDPLFELIIRDRGSLDLHPNDLPECDAVFIDGDHSAMAVERDSALAQAVLKPGGIIIWHDYHNDQIVDVRQVVDRLSDNLGWPICAVKDTWLAFSRKVG